MSSCISQAATRVYSFRVQKDTIPNRINGIVYPEGYKGVTHLAHLVLYHSTPLRPKGTRGLTLALPLWALEVKGVAGGTGVYQEG